MTTNWIKSAPDVTSSDNPTKTNFFKNISESGLFTCGPFSSSDYAGTYTIKIPTIGGNVNRIDPNNRFTRIGTFPYSLGGSFNLKIIDPCRQGGIISTSALPGDSISVFDA